MGHEGSRLYPTELSDFHIGNSGAAGWDLVEENREIDSRARRERARQIPRKRDPAGALGLGEPSVNVCWWLRA
jgi:hypothetical protein